MCLAVAAGPRSFKKRPSCDFAHHPYPFPLAREQTHPSPAAWMAVSAETRCRRPSVRRSGGARLSRRGDVALAVPVRHPVHCAVERGGKRRSKRLRLPRATSRVAFPARLARAEKRRGVRAVDDQVLRGRRNVGVPLRVRRRDQGERRAFAIGQGAFVWSLRRCISGVKPSEDPMTPRLIQVAFVFAVGHG